jgi:hypothetical protein
MVIEAAWQLFFLTVRKRGVMMQPMGVYEHRNTSNMLKKGRP